MDGCLVDSMRNGVVGCTEIPLALTPDRVRSLKVRVMDPMRLLAEAIVRLTVDSVSTDSDVAER